MKKKPTKASPVKGAIAVEAMRPDGSTSLYVGREVARDADTVTLVECSWIAYTGRRHKFFAGTPDETVEVEPYPDTMEVMIPLAGAVLYSWPHDLPRSAR